MTHRPTRSRSQTQTVPPPYRPTWAQGLEPSGEFTGRYLVVLRDDGIKEGLQALKDTAGLGEVCNSADYESAAVEMTQANEAEVFVLDKLKVAVVDADPSQAGSLMTSAASNAILSVEPERIMYAWSLPPDPFAAGTSSFEYLRGYKDAVNHLYAALTGAAPGSPLAAIAAEFSDDAQFTWGLRATRVSQSRFTGRFSTREWTWLTRISQGGGS